MRPAEVFVVMLQDGHDEKVTNKVLLLVWRVNED